MFHPYFEHRGLFKGLIMSKTAPPFRFYREEYYDRCVILFNSS